MKASIELDDLRENTCQKLGELTGIIHAGDMASEKRSHLFRNEADGLMELLHAAMTLTGIASRKAEALDDVADIWKSFVDLCDDVLKVLSELQRTNPDCVDARYYDKALDYRNAANSRYLLHR